MKCKKTLILLVLMTSCLLSRSQTALIDSLRLQVQLASNPEQKLSALVVLCEEYQSINRDSFDSYGPQIKTLAMATNNPRLKSLAALAYANWYFRWGWSDSALVFIEPELEKNNVNDERSRDVYFKLSRAKAMYHGSKQRYEEALSVLYKILPEAEKYKDTLTTASVMNTIGSIAIARSQHREAINWISKAMVISENNKKYIGVLAPAYLNAANAYAQLNKLDSAIYFIDKGLPLCRSLQNLHYLATALRIRSTIYTATGNFSAAEKAMLEMIAVRKKTSPISQVVEDNLQLAAFYASSGQLDKAIEVCRKYLVKGDLTVADSADSKTFNNDPKLRLEYLQLIAGYYKKAGRLGEYQSSLEELLIAKDSLYAANSADAIAAIQTEYEVQRRENTILQQKFDLQKKNFLLYGSMALLIVLLLLAFFGFRNYRGKQRAEMEILLEEQKINAAMAVKKAEENERVRIAADLHDNLGAYAASMSSNIGYMHLQNGNAATQTALDELSMNANAISAELNDTIWVLQTEEQGLTAVSDRIKTFIYRLKKSYPSVHIEVQENILTDYQLPSSQAFHLYRILQEAINNALKHSRGNNIIVNIQADKYWRVCVEDDGIGISESFQPGNGIRNIKKRAAEAGWNIQWKEKKSGGTLLAIVPHNLADELKKSDQ